MVNMVSGLKIATLYGYRPHQLGLCGPEEARRQQILKKFLRGKISPAKAKKILQGFKGAYPYYKLIARINKIKDPFDERVISAYWIGNKLLDKVKIDDLRQMIVNEFSGPGLLPKKLAAEKARAIPKNSRPHHSFHVLAIGSVTGSIDFKNTLLKDVCRVSWGIVKSKIKNQKSKIIIKYQPLVGEKEIKLGKPVKKEIFWDKNLISKIKTSDRVSFHWNYAIQVLTKQQADNLKKYTQNTLSSLMLK